MWRKNSRTHLISTGRRQTSPIDSPLWPFLRSSAGRPHSRAVLIKVFDVLGARNRLVLAEHLLQLLVVCLVSHQSDRLLYVVWPRDFLYDSNFRGRVLPKFPVLRRRLVLRCKHLGSSYRAVRERIANSVHQYHWLSAELLKFDDVEFGFASECRVQLQAKFSLQVTSRVCRRIACESAPKSAERFGPSKAAASRL